MKSLACLLGLHDDLRAYSPGWLRLKCQSCGRETPGLRGPTTHVEPPLVTVRKPRPKKPTKLRVVTPRQTRRMA
jgi:hypothetical protein